jgi:hypothetical protein
MSRDRPAKSEYADLGARVHILGVGLLAVGLLAVGLTACVDLAPTPQGQVGVGYYQTAYPQMVLVPGYPVYYDPYARANYFFYDGMYWLYQYDNWYASSWYNGPWGMVGPRYVPYYVLRVPVRYYRAPPPYFRGWHQNEPPHWGQHWGHDWEEHRGDWNHWDYRSDPPPAPLPRYQRDYSGDHYPRDPDRQQAIRDENYRYEPRDEVTRQQWRQHEQHRPQPVLLQPVHPSQPAQVTPPQATPRYQQSTSSEPQESHGQSPHEQRPPQDRQYHQQQPSSVSPPPQVPPPSPPTAAKSPMSPPRHNLPPPQTAPSPASSPPAEPSASPPVSTPAPPQGEEHPEKPPPVKGWTVKGDPPGQDSN